MALSFHFFLIPTLCLLHGILHSYTFLFPLNLPSFPLYFYYSFSTSLPFTSFFSSSSSSCPLSVAFLSTAFFLYHVFLYLFLLSSLTPPHATLIFLHLLYSLFSPFYFSFFMILPSHFLSSLPASCNSFFHIYQPSHLFFFQLLDYNLPIFYSPFFLIFLLSHRSLLFFIFYLF